MKVEFGRLCDTELVAYKELVEHLHMTGYMPGVRNARVIYDPKMRQYGWWLELDSDSLAARAHAKYANARGVRHCPNCGEHIEVGRA